MGNLNYKVYFTPLVNSDANTYGTEIDVSDYIRVDGVGSIRRSIDASDYDVGVFVFSDLELTGFNYNGYFNDDDLRSIFESTRDRCKVRIVFENASLVRDSSGTVLSESASTSITFRGLINDEATRADLTNETIRFKVLSLDSVLRTSKISGGVVTAGMTAKQAIESILNDPRITSVLNFSAGDINPSLNFVIDVGSFFDKKSVKEGLDALMLASNSVLLIDSSQNIIVRDRQPDETKPILNLYGKFDIHRRENIIDITSYNNGRQRMFTSFKVNNVIRDNPQFIQAFGLRQKKITFDFITTGSVINAVADELVNEFKAPKIELAVKVATDLARNVDLLDRVSVNYPLRLKPIEGKFLPIVGITKIDDADMPIPYQFGALAIHPRIAFKVIEIEDNPDSMTSVLKLRQTGQNLEDGVFDVANNVIVDFAVIDFAVLESNGSFDDQWNPSCTGAARLGSTRVA